MRWAVGFIVAFAFVAGVILLRMPDAVAVENDLVECQSIVSPTVRTLGATFPLAENLTLQKTFCFRYKGPDPIYWLILTGDLSGKLEHCVPFDDLRNATPDQLALLFPTHAINGFSGWCGVYRQNARSGITLIPVPDATGTFVAIVSFPF